MSSDDPPGSGAGGPGRRTSAELADGVATAALAVPGVLALHGGALGEVAVHLPGRRVSGVRLREDRTEVHVVLAVGAPVPTAAAAVQRAVAAVRPGRVDVTVADVREVGADPSDGAGAS